MTVLTTVLIVLFFCIMSLVGKIQGTARVVNYAGLVRGTTQRIVKLENMQSPQDEVLHHEQGKPHKAETISEILQHNGPSDKGRQD